MPPSPQARPTTKSPALPGLLLFLFAAAIAQAAPTAPDWVQAEAAKPASFKYGKAAVAILLDEKTITVGKDGTFVHRVREVKRLLTEDGRSAARASIGYTTSAYKIKSFQAWLIRPQGPVLVYGKKNVIDTSVDTTGRDLYSERRRQSIAFRTDDALPGSVFAYEAVYEEESIFSQTYWSFADNHPVERSRLILQLAEGWKAQSHTLNHTPFEPVVSGNVMTWEQTQIPAVKSAPFAPDARATHPWMGIDIKPPAGAKTCRQPLFTWEAIARYWAPIYEKAATPDDAIKAKSAEICAGAATQRERIERLCRYAQQTEYVHILLNAAEGGGSIPQPSAKVLRCNYGDCKDKATLLHSMLKTQGITSFPLIVRAGDHRALQHEWPTGGQFNHAILAIPMDESIDAPALASHPQLGRLVIFDPTHPYVPFGHLPERDCGGFAMLIDRIHGGTLQLPPVPADFQKRTIEATLSANGSVDATLSLHLVGSSAASLRVDHRRHSATDFKDRTKAMLQAKLPVLELTGIETADDFAANRFDLKLNITALGYGKMMRDVLLVFKPLLFSRSDALPRERKKRTLPVVINPVNFTETARFTLPAGSTVEELPKAVELNSPVGTYSYTVRKEDDAHLVFERSLQLQESTVPAQDYDAIRTFADKIADSEQSPVVLRMK